MIRSKWDTTAYSEQDDEFVNAVGIAMLEVAVSHDRSLLELLGAMDVAKHRLIDDERGAGQ